MSLFFGENSEIELATAAGKNEDSALDANAVKKRQVALSDIEARDEPLHFAYTYWEGKRKGGLLPCRNDIDILDLRPVLKNTHMEMNGAIMLRPLRPAILVAVPGLSRNSPRREIDQNAVQLIGRNIRDPVRRYADREIPGGNDRAVIRRQKVVPFPLFEGTRAKPGCLDTAVEMLPGGTFPTGPCRDHERRLKQPPTPRPERETRRMR